MRELGESLRRLGGALWTVHGRARDDVPALALRLQAQAVYANRDYEPAALERDRDVQRRLLDRQIDFHTCKDQVIFECDEVLTQARRQFSVFTPYKQAWLGQLRPVHLAPHAVEQHAAALTACRTPPIPSLESMGFEQTNLGELGLPTGSTGAKAWLDDFLGRIGRYRERRDYPAVRGPSYLSVHLRFGTLSIRELVRAARRRDDAGAQTWLSELIWRELYFMILYHHPRVVNHAFRPRARPDPFRESGTIRCRSSTMRGRAKSRWIRTQQRAASATERASPAATRRQRYSNTLMTFCTPPVVLAMSAAASPSSRFTSPIR